MLRRALPRLASAAAARPVSALQPNFPSAARSFSVPCTKDKVAYVTFINNVGERMRAPGLQGQTVYEVAINNKVTIGDMMTCHVILTPDSYKAHSPPMSEEQEILETFDNRTPTSRMASFINLDPSIKETLVALTDYRDTFIP